MSMGSSGCPPQRGPAERLRAELRLHSGLPPGARVLVALSGGLDSVVLLHLLRFRAAPVLLDVCAAHFDHRMRPTSQADAAWVAGLCRAWDVPLVPGGAERPLRSEEEAREARYSFLEAARRELGAAAVLTAHHADDLAETVLFRVLRGTGPAGLVGIAQRRDPHVYRPLLGLWRTELEEYAREARLAWREDATNQDARFARNALRQRVLPEIENRVAPGARRALVRLAEIACDNESGWQSVLPAIMAPLDVRPEPGGVSMRREAFLALHAAVRARVLRALAEGLGARLDKAATRRALDFSETGGSGRRVDLGGPWRLGRDLDRLVLSIEVALPADRPVWIPDAGPGSGEGLLGGRALTVRWSASPSIRGAEAFDVARLRFPLLVRAREPGDRIRLPGGTKKVKRLLLERRIPLAERRALPVLVDAEGQILWIPRLARAMHAAVVDPDGPGCWIGVG
jgi:tRNA(Ile)-lysidine synthase